MHDSRKGCLAHHLGQKKERGEERGRRVPRSPFPGPGGALGNPCRLSCKLCYTRYRAGTGLPLFFELHFLRLRSLLGEGPFPSPSLPGGDYHRDVGCLSLSPLRVRKQLRNQPTTPPPSPDVSKKRLMEPKTEKTYEWLTLKCF